MLELKHSSIVGQFCAIYDQIVFQLKNVDFESVEKEQGRFQWLNGVRDRIVGQILENGERFEYFGQFLKEDQKETKKLVLVEAYCFLAEKFNFNINQFYSEAFAVPMEGGKGSKRVKKGA